MTRTAAKSRISLATRIADSIRAAIIDAEFDLGENLSEDSLAAAFECSRTPVREAFGLLQAEGLVRIVPQSGTYIFNPSEPDVAELCDFRAALEAAAMRFLARLPHDCLPHDLRPELAGMERAMAEGDIRGYGQADTAFHRKIVEASGNRHLVHSYAIILGRVAALRTHLVRHAEGEPQRSYLDHLRIVELLDAGRAAELPGMLEDHILRTRTNYVTAIAARARTHADPRTERLRRKLRRDGAATDGMTPPQ